MTDERASWGRPRLSPDGRWIAYTSNDSGRDSFFLQRAGNFDLDADGKRLVVVERGSGRPRGPELRVVFNRVEKVKRRVPIPQAPAPDGPRC